jgi:signal transduction histidine kinase
MFGIEPVSLSQDQFNQCDLYFRFLRGSLFIVSEIVIFVYWLQTQSTIALTEAKNKESIFNLLAEKDKLIAHLVNTRALVETGALSAGVAHEINQFLTRIQLNSEEAESFLGKTPVPSQVQDALLRIQDSVRDASKVISSIKKLFSKTDPEYSMTRIDVLLSEMVDIYFERAQQSRIRIETQLEAERVWQVSDTLLRQVIGNLIVNAIEALEPAVHLNKKILILSYVRDRHLCIDVIDNGPGVAPNKIHNLFSLFDTNKSNGSGVGLWLSLCIIEQHSGRINYSEALNGGAVFSIAIPDNLQIDSKIQKGI